MILDWVCSDIFCNFMVVDIYFIKPSATNMCKFFNDMFFRNSWEFLEIIAIAVDKFYELVIDFENATQNAAWVQFLLSLIKCLLSLLNTKLCIQPTSFLDNTSFPIASKLPITINKPGYFREWKMTLEMRPIIKNNMHCP